MVGGIFLALCHTVITNPPGVNLVKLLVGSGFVEFVAHGVEVGFGVGSGAVDC